MHKLGSVSSINASLYEITNVLFILAKILTSFNAFCFSFSDNFLSLTFFKAYIFESAFLFTLNTTLYAPSPNYDINSKPFILFLIL